MVSERACSETGRCAATTPLSYPLSVQPVFPLADNAPRHLLLGRKETVDLRRSTKRSEVLVLPGKQFNGQVEQRRGT